MIKLIKWRKVCLEEFPILYFKSCICYIRLLRVGFLELDKETPNKSVTNSIADRGTSEVEVEHRHDSVIFHEENKQNSATARYNNIKFNSCSNLRKINAIF